jgi:two-component system, chemotaxis family, response regulator Rcp1
MRRKTVNMSFTPEILLVDDNPADTDLVSGAFATSNRGSRVHAVCDGEEAMAFLRRAGKYTDAVRPHLVMLDLNLPRRHGNTVLADVKADPELRQIPVVIFTTSRSGRDVTRSYEMGANCYVSKPGKLADFFAAVQSIEAFWFGCVCLPGAERL